MDSLQSTLAQHPFLKDLNPQHLPLLAEGAALVRFAPGQVIAQEGQEAQHFYLILKGKIALETLAPGQEQVQVLTIGAGDALGWSWLFPPFQWHFSPRAVEETEAVQWDTAQLRAKAEAHPQFGYELARRMTGVLLQRLQATHTQLLDFYGPPG